MTDVEALAAYLHELHSKLGRLLIRDLNDATDCYYRPTPGGLLEEYLQAVDELGDRFNIRDRERFYPPGDRGTDEEEV